MIRTPTCPSSWKRAHPLERNRPADVDVRRGDVDAELHPQRPAQGELRLEASLRQDVDGVPDEVWQGHGATLPSALALLRKRNRPPKRRRIRKLRLLALLVRAGAARILGVRLRRADVRLGTGVGAEPAPPAGARAEHLYLRERRAHRPRRPARLAGANRRALGRDRPADQAGDRRDRGQAVLRAPRRRHPRHRPRRLGRRDPPGHRPGRLDDHAAVRQERDQRQRPHADPQAEGGRARLEARAGLDEGRDPDRLPEHDLLRQPRLRRRGGVQGLLRAQREERQPRRGGAARRHPREPEPLRPGRPPGRDAPAPEPRAPADVPPALPRPRSAPALAEGAAAEPGLGPAAGDPPGRRRAVLRELRDRPAPRRSTRRARSTAAGSR